MHAPIRWSNTTYRNYSCYWFSFIYKGCSDLPQPLHSLYSLEQYTDRISSVHLGWHLISFYICVYPLIADQSLLILWTFEIVSCVSLLVRGSLLASFLILGRYSWGDLFAFVVVCTDWSNGLSFGLPYCKHMLPVPVSWIYEGKPWFSRVLSTVRWSLGLSLFVILACLSRLGKTVLLLMPSYNLPIVFAIFL